MQHYDDRQIVSKGQYMFEDDLEFVDDLSEKQVAHQDSNVMDEVMAGIQKFFQKKTVTSMQSMDNLEESKDSMAASQTNKKKDEIRKAMGSEVFDYYYGFLYEKRQDPSTDEAKLRSDLNQMIGSNKTLKNLIFELEQVIFKEMQA